MAVGNVIAIAQTNLKRMLAYSTISHVGFLLLGIIAGTPAGYGASLAAGDLRLGASSPCIDAAALSTAIAVALSFMVEPKPKLQRWLPALSSFARNTSSPPAAGSA